MSTTASSAEPLADEILGVFQRRHDALSIGDVRQLVWEHRGGRGNVTSIRTDNTVPVPSVHGVRKLLLELVDTGALATCAGDDPMPLPTRGYRAASATYYLLPEDLRVHRRDYDAHLAAQRRLLDVVDLVRNHAGDRATAVEHYDGLVRVDLTTEQACALFGLPVPDQPPTDQPATPNLG